MDKEYYFVNYRWKNEREGILEWKYENTLLEEHPVLWLSKTRKFNSLYSDYYEIEFYKEITKDIYHSTYSNLHF